MILSIRRQHRRGRTTAPGGPRHRRGAERAGPDNPDYRRGLSVSYSKLADLARAAGNTGEADGWIDKALEIRRSLNEIEPARLDFAEEFAFVLYLSALIDAELERAANAETENLLVPFE